MKFLALCLVFMFVLSVCSALYLNELPVDSIEQYKPVATLNMLNRVANRLQNLKVITHWTRTANQLQTISQTWQELNGITDLFRIVKVGFELLIDNSFGLTLDVAYSVFQLVAILGEVIGFAFDLGYDGNYYNPNPIGI